MHVANNFSRSPHVQVWHLTSSRLPDEANLLLTSDSGELELWNCHPPGHTLEHKTSLSSHDDMALTVGLLAGGEKAVSGGADRRCVPTGA